MWGGKKRCLCHTPPKPQEKPLSSTVTCIPNRRGQREQQWDDLGSCPACTGITFHQFKLVYLGPTNTCGSDPQTPLTRLVTEQCPSVCVSEEVHRPADAVCAMLTCPRAA